LDDIGQRCVSKQGQYTRAIVCMICCVPLLWNIFPVYLFILFYLPLIKAEHTGAVFLDEDNHCMVVIIGRALKLKLLFFDSLENNVVLLRDASTA
jgi:hypothetical protein